MRTLEDEPTIPRTEAEAAVEQLRRDIVSGVLAPEIKLKVRELSARYRISASPMREALAQLAASGFVVHHGQKGYRVPPISTENLVDITECRKFIEAEALRLAIRHADANWEDEILASFHLFERQVMRFYDGEDRNLDVYEEKHHRFHRALIAACPLRTLKAFCHDLYLRKTRYRALTRSYGFSKDAVIAEHRILKDAVLKRDEEAAAEAIKAHIGITAEIILKLLPLMPDKPITIAAPIAKAPVKGGSKTDKLSDLKTNKSRRTRKVSERA